MGSLPLFFKYSLVFLVSMVPIVELRGAIPIAEGLGLNIFLYYTCLIQKRLKISHNLLVLHKKTLSHLHSEYIITVFNKISISPKRYRHYTTKLEKCQYIFKKFIA